MLVKNELTELFKMLTDGDTYDTMCDSLNVLDLYNMDYMTTFDMMLGYEDDTPDSDVFHKCYNVILSTHRSLIRQSGIELNDDILLYEMTELSRSLFEVMLVEDKQPLKDIMSLGISDNEKVARMLAHVGTLDETKILTMLEYVDDSLIARIKSILVDVDDSDTLAVAEHVKSQEFQTSLIAYRNYKAYMNNDPMWCDQFIVNPGSIGLNSELYLKFYLHDVIPKMQMLDVEKISRDLIGIACLSSDYVSTPMGLVRSAIGLITNDQAICTQIDTRCIKITGEMNNAQK